MSGEVIALRFLKIFAHRVILQLFVMLRFRFQLASMDRLPFLDAGRDLIKGEVFMGAVIW